MLREKSMVPLPESSHQRLIHGASIDADDDIVVHHRHSQATTPHTFAPPAVVHSC
ncbi:hypothetical protein U1Q18_031966, partial [Sarracenia purpurea var. burkii]